MAIQQRPVASSPSPAHCIVEPGSLASEALKAKVPASAPLPVFSTRALDHGRDAVGARALKEGFAWNATMDLLWALGFPKVLFIVDGFPALDTKAALLEAYGAKLEALGPRRYKRWFDRVSLASGHLLSRRAAYALIYELQQGVHPFALDDDEFLRVTEPRDLTREEVSSLLLSIRLGAEIEYPALVLEALVGPSWVASSLCEMIEDQAPDRRNDWRGAAASALLPMLLRVPAAEAEAIRERLRQVTLPAGDLSGPFVATAIDPLEKALRSMDEGKSLEYAATRFQWLSGQEERLLQCYNAKSDRGDIPNARYMFAGGQALIELEVAHAAGYSDWPEVFGSDFSTIQHPLLLRTVLGSVPSLPPDWDWKWAPTVELWLAAHASAVRPHLEALTRDSELGERARAFLAQLP